MIATLRATLVFLAIGSLAASGCHRTTASGSTPGSAPESAATTAATPKRTFDHRFTIDVGGQPVRMRLAVSTFEQERGLMLVPSMPEDEGMLFVYDHTQRMSFWMRNTILPLDIGYFDAAGMLREIHAMYPHVEDPVTSATDTMQFALEMNQGWFARHGVKPGAKIDLPTLRAALHERGLDGERFVPSH